MKQNYDTELFKLWTDVYCITFERKLENETAFDGIVKIYSLKSNNEEINKELNGYFFGDFFYEVEYGIFLRMFENKDSWPKTSLVYLDLIDRKLVQINSNNSSWTNWKGNDLGNRRYLIKISPSENIEFQL
jgi:hypothetical protein